MYDLTRESHAHWRRIMSGSRTSPTSVWRRSSSIRRWSWTPFSRKVAGWALADHLQAGFSPLEALDKAIASRGGSLKDLIHHSDCGVQYACRDYALRLSQIGFTPA